MHRLAMRRDRWNFVCFGLTPIAWGQLRPAFLELTTHFPHFGTDEFSKRLQFTAVALSEPGNRNSDKAVRCQKGESKSIRCVIACTSKTAI